MTPRRPPMVVVGEQKGPVKMMVLADVFHPPHPVTTEAGWLLAACQSTHDGSAYHGVQHTAN